MESNSVRICPKCLSTSVSREKSDQGIGAIAGINNWVCDDCSFSSRFFPLMDEEELKSLKESGVSKSGDPISYNFHIPKKNM